MVFATGNPARQMFLGNILLLCCCGFYLLWWVLAFRPAGAVRGMRSGWLLIPAFLLGIAAVVMIVRGANGADAARSFFSAGTVFPAGVIFYVALLVVTRFAFHRQATTELFLIVGWTALVFLESNALYGLEIIGWGGTIVLFAAAVIVAAVSLVCYLLYYDLDSRTGYVDGMIPLILVAACMAALAVCIARAGN